MRQLFALFFLLAVTSHAALLRIEVADRHDVLSGQPYGKSGAYELIRGRAYFAVDPALPQNSRITDIRFAPRSPSGSVEFSADVVLIRPKDAKAGNGTLLVEPPNRGGMGMLSMYNRARASADPSAAEHFGDGYLMREGYTLAWIGWQHDVPERPGLLRSHVPAAAGVEGLVRGEITPSSPVRRFPLGDNGHIPYKVSRPESLAVTVRDGIHGKRSPLVSTEWRLEGTEIALTMPATPGRTYEFVYRSQDPPIAGLGLAALRDLVSELKYGAGGSFGGRIRHAIGAGTSQSAMVLKALVYEGFNADEKGRLVFDGLQPHVAGGRRATFERFAQPSRTSGPYRDASFSTTDQFPYSDAEDMELVTGRRDSILSRARAASLVPKIIYTNSSYEYWGSAGALAPVSLDGKRDLDLPETTRVYLLAGGQHGPAAFPPHRGGGQNLPNWNDYKWALRAILTDLREWVVKGTAPPPSRYPKVSAGTLVRGGPSAHRTQYLDFGPEYLAKGIIAHQPPKTGADYAALTPKPDSDGNDLEGVKMPWVAVPLGAFTGWNLRAAAIGAEGGLLANTGSYMPFPEQRIRKQYQSRAEYVRQIETAARQLVKDRFLLEDDIPQIVRQGGRIWDWSMGDSRQP
ncbi:MAG: alpha/beta hydrolase domain-containing protein [Bryobacteraceae bacterium]